MMEGFLEWYGSLDVAQQIGVHILLFIVGIIVYVAIETLISDAVKKGIKEAHYELIEEWKRKRGG